MSILDSYNKLVKPTTSLPNDSFDTHIPTPSKIDYSRGYISRYFMKKVNDINSPIFEIDSKTYLRFQTNPLFSRCSLKWRISGPKETQYRENGDVFDVSVSESNRRAIKLVYEKIPTLKLYLPNLLQFYK
jgi:hypothetical protein